MLCEHMAESDMDHLADELRELDLLCSAVVDGDGTGKLRGKLNRLHASLTSFETSGDLSAFREDLRSAMAFVEQLHSQDPLTRLLERLSGLDRQMSEGPSPERNTSGLLLASTPEGEGRPPC
jgi:hypothetical protein